MRIFRLLKRDLAREARAWVDSGLIDGAQGRAICARYGIDYDNPERHGLGYSALVILGYLFVGLSLLTLVGANWDELPRWLRTASLAALVLAANLLGLRRHLAGRHDAAVGWFFLGALFYGTAIMLIAQIYHLGEHYPDGIFWWALGVLPIALLLQSSLLTLLMLVLAGTWLLVESDLGFFPTLFPLFIAAGLYDAWRHGGSAPVLLLSLAGVLLYAEYGVAWWLDPAPGYAVGPENLVVGIGLLFVLRAGGGWLTGRDAPLRVAQGELLAAWVLRLFVLLLLVFSFAGPWEALLDATWYRPGVALAAAILLAAASVGITMLARTAAWPVLAGTALYLLLTAVLLLAGGSGDSGARPGAAVALQVADNLLLVGLGIGLIVRAIGRRSSHDFYLGLGCILATGLLRYIDLVGNYVGSAVLFAVFAAVLLGAARFWKASYARNARPRAGGAP